MRCREVKKSYKMEEVKERKAVFSIGSNLGNRAEWLGKAVERLDTEVGRVEKVSKYYETEPVGFESVHRFLNAAVILHTTLSPEELLEVTRRIECGLGRIHKSTDGRYADRTIDIDLLLVDEERRETPGLTLPHPHMTERRFVLEPLCEIEPGLQHPLRRQTVKELLQELNRGAISELKAGEETPEMCAALKRLLTQLSPESIPVCVETLREITTAPDVKIYLLRDEEGTVQGMATLSTDRLLTGTKAWIEDVVVDKACRGRGYGRQLVRYLVEAAREAGAKSVNLTSRPGREEANRLYRSEGFVKRETNVYRYGLKTPEQGAE